MPAPDRLDPDKITANLQTSRIGRRALVFASTSSTNDLAAEYARDKANHGLVIFAEAQTAGRGRADNKWLDQPYHSILCSVLLTQCTVRHELLSLTAAVAVAQAIAHNAKIKWPNDILINANKVAGILLESKPCPYGRASIIGIGINCHQQQDSFPPELRELATSIDIETRTFCDRISLARRLLTCLDQWIDLAHTDKNLLINCWRSLSTQLGHRLTVLYDQRRFTGRCIGIDPEKGLILRLDSDSVTFFPAAHSTIIQ